jgi:hypothetical protein
MKTNFRKIEHIKKSNQILERRVVKEQPEIQNNSLSYRITLEIPSRIRKHMASLGIPEKNYQKVFQNYLEDMMGLPYNMELDYFREYTNNEDNITDYKEYTDFEKL